MSFVTYLQTKNGKGMIFFCFFHIVFWSFITKGFFPVNLLTLAWQRSIIEFVAIFLFGLFLIFLAAVVLELLTSAVK